MKRLVTTAILAVLLVTVIAGVAFGFLPPVPGGTGLLPIGLGPASSGCGLAVSTAVERPLDPPAHRLGWTAGPRIGAWQVFVADADGSNRTRITSGDTFHGEPAWSPDGTRVAFVQRDLKEVDHIWVADADGSNARLLVPNASSPAWSPDGTRLAYWDSNDSSISVLAPADGVPVRVVDIDRLRALVPDGGDPRLAGYYPWGRPAWSPDGTRLAFAFFSGPNLDLAIASLDGQLTRLTDTDRCGESGPAWSSDGRIVYSADAEATPMRNIAAIRPDGTGRERLTPLSDVSQGNPAVSPDGRTIAVALSLDDGARSAIAVMNADGTGAQTIALEGPANASDGPAWVP